MGAELGDSRREEFASLVSDARHLVERPQTHVGQTRRAVRLLGEAVAMLAPLLVPQPEPEPEPEPEPTEWQRRVANAFDVPVHLLTYGPGIDRAREVALDLVHEQDQRMQGATDPGDYAREAHDPGEFAARWNAMTPEARVGMLASIYDNARTAMRCTFEEDHAERIERLTERVNDVERERDEAIARREEIATAAYERGRRDGVAAGLGTTDTTGGGDDGARRTVGSAGSIPL